MPYDASKMKDWQIAEAAEEHLPGPDEWREKLGLKKNEMIPYGKTPKLDFMKIGRTPQEQTGWEIYRDHCDHPHSHGRR